MGMYAALNIAVKRPEIRDTLISYLSNFIESDIEFKSLQVRLFPKPHIIADNVLLRSRHTGDQTTMEKLAVDFNFSQLLHLTYMPEQIRCYRPKLTLALKKGSTDSTVLQAPFPWPKQLRAIFFTEGTIELKGLDTTVQSLNVALVREPNRQVLALNTVADGKIFHAQESGYFRIVGLLQNETIDYNLKNLDANIALTCDKWPLKWIPDLEAFHNIDGFGNVNMQVNGRLSGELHAKGVLEFNPLIFRLVRSRGEKDYAIPFTSIGFQIRGQGSHWTANDIRFSAPDLDLEIDLDVSPNKSGELEINLQTESGEMTAEVFNEYFPAPLLPQWITKQVMQKFEGGNVKLNKLSIKGTPRQIKRSDHPEYASAVSCDVAFSKVKSSKNFSPLPLQDFSANVRYQNGAVDISESSFTFGESKVEELHIQAGSVLTSEFPITVKVKGTVLLKDIIKQSEMDIFPDYIPEKIAQYEKLDGKIKIDLHARKIWREAGPPDLQGTASGTDIILKHKLFSQTLKLKSCIGRFHENGKIQADGTGFMDAVPVRLEGWSKLWWDPLNKYSFIVQTEMDKTQVRSLMGNKSKSIPDFTLGNKLPLTATITGDASKIFLSGKAGISGLEVACNPYPLKFSGKNDALVFEGSYSSDEGFILSSLTIMLPSSTFKAYGKWSPRGYALNLVADHINMLDVCPALSRFAESESGVLSGELFVRSGMKGEMPSVNGSLRGKNFSFETEFLPSSIRNLDFMVRFSDRELEIQSSDFIIGSSKLHLTGIIKDLKPVQGNLVVDARYLNIEDLIHHEEDMPFQGRGTKPSSGRIPSGFSISVSGNMDKGKWKDFYFNNLSYTGTLDSRELNIGYLNFSTQYGVYNSKLTIPIEGRQPYKISLFAELKNQPFQDLAKSIGWKTERLNGLLDLHADLKATASKLDEVPADLNGHMNFTLKKGTIKESNVLLKIFALLNMEKMFKGKFPHFGEGGMDYETISSNINVNDGIAEFNDFRIDGADVRFAGTGEVAIKDRTIDAKIGVAPLVTVDSIVSKIPLAGYILTGKNKSLLTFYFDVKGPVENPDVKMIPIQSIAETLFGILKRTLTRPFFMFDRANNDEFEPMEESNNEETDLLPNNPELK